MMLTVSGVADSNKMGLFVLNMIMEITVDNLQGLREAGQEK